jgi:hypothetical protein
MKQLAVNAAEAPVDIRTFRQVSRSSVFRLL